MSRKPPPAIRPTPSSIPLQRLAFAAPIPPQQPVTGHSNHVPLVLDTSSHRLSLVFGLKGQGRFSAFRLRSAPLTTSQTPRAANRKAMNRSATNDRTGGGPPLLCRPSFTSTAVTSTAVTSTGAFACQTVEAHGLVQTYADEQR